MYIVQCTFTRTLRVSYSTFFLKNNLPIPMFLLFIAKYYYNIFVLFLQYHRRSNKNIKIALSDVFSIFWLTWAARDVSGYSVRFHRYFRTFPTFVAPKLSSCIVTLSVVDPYTLYLWIRILNFAQFGSGSEWWIFGFNLTPFASC